MSLGHLKSKKWSMSLIGLALVTLLALSGVGSPAAFGAIGIIVGIACGGQAAVDYRRG